jgi:predicted glycogen debranching enzyme
VKEPLRVMTWTADERARPTYLLSREWLGTNGLGGYASGTVAGVPTRRYHGLLVAALPAPLGRVVMLNRLSERIKLPGGVAARLGGVERREALKVHSASSLSEFRLEAGLPVWRFKVGEAQLEKRIVPFTARTRRT